MNRDATINFLVTNCDCWKGKQAVLANKEAFTDADLEKLKTNVEQSKANALTVNSIRKECGAADVALNEMPAFIKEKIAAKGKKPVVEEEDEEEEEEVEEVEEKPTKNSKQQSFAELVKNGTPDEQGAYARMMRIDREARARAVARLIANAKEEHKSTLDKLYRKHTTEELEAMAAALPVSNQRQPREEVLDYAGVGGFDLSVNQNDLANNEAGSDDGLALPTFNYAEDSPLFKQLNGVA